MTNRPFRFGPIALTSTLTTNLLNPPTLTGGVNASVPVNTYIILRKIRVVNKTGGGVTCSLWVGATGANAAGTEFGFQATNIAANSFSEIFGYLRLDVADFLVGGASANTSLSIEGEGEIGIA